MCHSVSACPKKSAVLWVTGFGRPQKNPLKTKKSSENPAKKRVTDLDLGRYFISQLTECCRHLTNFGVFVVGQWGLCIVFCWVFVFCGLEARLKFDMKDRGGGPLPIYLSICNCDHLCVIIYMWFVTFFWSNPSLWARNWTQNQGSMYVWGTVPRIKVRLRHVSDSSIL